MPEQTLSPADFEFTECGELVVRGEQLRAALANARGGAGSSLPPPGVAADHGGRDRDAADRGTASRLADSDLPPLASP
jgi:hypothetical protein